jgi:hypothetical protein
MWLADIEWRNGTALWGGRRLERSSFQVFFWKNYVTTQKLIYDGRWSGRDSSGKLQNKVVIVVAWNISLDKWRYLEEYKIILLQGHSIKSIYIENWEIRLQKCTWRVNRILVSPYSWILLFLRHSSALEHNPHFIIIFCSSASSHGWSNFSICIVYEEIQMPSRIIIRRHNLWR